MPRDPKLLRKSYEIKIGKDLADKLSNDQIGILSKFYNQLSKSEQSDIDSRILMGYSDTPLHQMAEEFISEREDTSSPITTGLIDEEDDDDDFEPLGLEELLANIKEETKKDNAITLYEGIRQDDLVNEEIDERILRLLDLEEVFDIDYGSYLTLLKEKMIAIGMTQQELSTEESELLTDEFKRVKGKVGRFTIKKKKINVGGVAPIKPKKFLKPAEIVKKGDQESEVTDRGDKKKRIDPVSKYLEEIIPIVKSIRELLKSQLDVTKNIRNVEEKRYEKERRSDREENLEKKNKANKFFKKLKSIGPKLGIFDSIKRFITNVLLGKAVLSFLDWMSDPENTKRLKGLGKFLGDWWPALTAAFVMFATPLGIFIKGTIGLIAKFTSFILTKAIPKLLMFAAKNPLIAASLVAGGATLGAYLWNENEEDKQVKKESKKRGIPEETVRREIEQERDSIIGSIGDAFNNIGPLGFSGGGITPNLGTDIIPAMLTPGEFVMSKDAVDKIGIDNLMGLNAVAGGTNKPRFIDGITYAAGGGPIGKSKGPQISGADYASLLGIASLEDDKAQGRADVAQSIYNRLYAAKEYGRNYMQKSNTLKDIITAKNQFEPTFDNYGDWINITDKRTAAIAVMNSSKGKRYGWSFEDALEQINETEKALNNPKLQYNAQKHVGGRAYFLGTSQQGNMKKGDVLRGSSFNFHSHWYDEGSKYQKERGNIPAPIPTMLRPKLKIKATQAKPKPVGPKGLVESLTDTEGLSGFYMKPINMIFGNQSSTSPIGDKTVRQLMPGAPQSNTVSMITLPPIAQNMNKSVELPTLGSTEPSFPTRSAFGSVQRAKKLDTYGVIG